MKCVRLLNAQAFLFFGLMLFGLQATGQNNIDTLVAKNSVWKYLDDGSNQYGLFEALDFDDSTWAEGPGRLGYGGDGETTIISFGPDANNKFVTTYFRKVINVSNPEEFKALLMNITRDDGIVVYVNGVEAARDNLPDEFDYLTYAPINITGANETTYFPFYINKSLLIAGDNIIAVGLHNRSASSSDLGFDMEFLGFKDAARFQIVHNSADLLASNFSIFKINGDTTLINSNFQYLQATELNELDIVQTTIVVCSAGSTEITEDNIVSSSSFFPEPGKDNIIFIGGVITREDELAFQDFIAIERNSAWRYNDTGIDPGIDWFSEAFDDAAWPTGDAPLGYGRATYFDGTLLSFGPSSSNKHIAYYFRKTFTLEDTTNIVAGLVKTRFDDGIVVYINGVEAFRRNMPNGAINHTTRANATVGTAPAVFTENEVPYTFFKQGENTIAVTVRQDQPGSSDVTMNLELEMLQSNVLIQKGSNWKYLDNGTDQGTAWTALNFDDSTWANGNAELGYGDGDEVTVVGFGPDAANKYPTTYFRHKFNVDSLGTLGNLDLQVLRDDGVVVYINGVEVLRDNMPAGPIDYLTLASATVDGNAERTFYSFTLPPTILVQGENIIAVSIHQDRPNSSDISFNLSLTAEQRGAFWPNPTGADISLTSASIVLPKSANEGNFTGNLAFYNGITDAGAFTLAVHNLVNGELAQNINFNNSALLNKLPTAAITLAATVSNQTKLYGVDLSQYQDSSLVFFTTGFFDLELNEVDENTLNNALAMVTEAGNVFILSEPFAQLTLVNNIADIAQASKLFTLKYDDNTEETVEVNQFNFSDVLTIPAARNVQVWLGADSLATVAPNYLFDYLFVAQGVNPTDEYFDNPNTDETVGYYGTFYTNPSQRNWFSQELEEETQVLFFQGVVDAPYLQIANLEGSSFISEDIAFNEFVGPIGLTEDFEFITLWDVDNLELHSIFTNTLLNSEPSTWVMFTAGFYFPEENPEGADEAFIWAFNAAGNRVILEQPKASVKVINFSADINLLNLTAKSNFESVEVSYLAFNDLNFKALRENNITIINSQNQEVLEIDLSNSEPNSTVELILFSGSAEANFPGLEEGETLAFFLVEPSDWEEFGSASVLNTLTTDRNLELTFYNDMEFNFTAPFASIEEVGLTGAYVIRTTVNEDEVYFHALPALDNEKFILINAGLTLENIGHNEGAEFAWFLYTENGDIIPLEINEDITIGISDVSLSVFDAKPFPNPMGNEVSIYNPYENAVISITSIVGTVVHTENLRNNGINSINIEKLNAGIYLLRIIDVNTQTEILHKVIKK
ncbi:MAG: T9SS type A sorting domain-containing protein [Luteibaculaceae bacterium]